MKKIYKQKDKQTILFQWIPLENLFQIYNSYNNLVWVKKAQIKVPKVK